MIWLASLGLALSDRQMRDATRVAVAAGGQLTLQPQSLAAVAKDVAVAGEGELACADTVLPGVAFSASSSKPGSGPEESTLEGDANAWIPEISTKEQWLQWTWTTPQEVRFLKVGGEQLKLITEFKLQYLGDDGTMQWYKTAHDEGQTAYSTLTAHRTADGGAKLTGLDPPIQTTALKLWPAAWTGDISLRADVLGCAGSAVEAANLDLAIAKAALYPSIFENAFQLHSEFRKRIADSLGCGLDQVQVIDVKPGTDSTSVIRIHILPKRDAKAPTELMKDLGIVLANSDSTLANFLKDVETSAGVVTTHKQNICMMVDCNEHGTCIGGQCFCTTGYSGNTCNEVANAAANVQAANEAEDGAEAAGTLIDQIKPATLMVEGAIPPPPSSSHETEATQEELTDDVNELAEEVQTEGLDDEEGLSGSIKRHMIIIPLILAGVVLIGVCLVCSTGRTKGEGLLDSGSPPSSARRS